MKPSESEIIREALNCLTRWQQQTVMAVPVSLGTVNAADLLLLSHDLKLLVKLGVTVRLAVRKDDTLYHQVLGPNLWQVESLMEMVVRALELEVHSLCLLAGTERIHTQHGDLDDLSVTQAKKIIQEETNLSHEAREVLKLAVQACGLGLSRVHLINVHRHGALLEELFTGRGAGTMVYAEKARYKQVRPAKPADALAISELLCRVHRQHPAQIFQSVSKLVASFLVYEVDGEIYGCGRLSRAGDSLEVRQLAHSSRFNGDQVLQSILVASLESAKQQQLAKVMVAAGELPPLMAIMPGFSHLGFTKETKSTGSGSKTAWVRHLP